MKYICQCRHMYFTMREVHREGLWVWISFTDQWVEGGAFEDLLNLWISYYDAQQPFTFVFETQGLTTIPSLSYAFQMALFIRTLTSRPKQYLQESHIFVSHKYLVSLLDWIFAIQRPVAPVFIYHGGGPLTRLTPDVHVRVCTDTPLRE
jgi:hypothetical protein